MRDFRRQNELTQKYVAYKMGVSQQAVEKWENGKSVPRGSLLPKLAQLVGCTIDELMIGG